MKYYQLAFNRPLKSNFTYGSHIALELGTRVKARLHNTLLSAIVIAEEDADVIRTLKEKNVHIKSIESVEESADLQKGLLFTEDLLQLAQWMSRYYLTSLGQCLFTMIPTAERTDEYKVSKEMISYFPTDFPNVTEDQQNSIDVLETALATKKSAFYYLHGVTGSGKTEVYLQVIRKLIAQGRQTIYLLPEIALVEQMAPLMYSRFGEENVAILHSRLSPRQKLQQWIRILEDKVSLVLGVRSAVFAPCKRLGLIVLDEENDSSYKSEKAPRYHARQVAMKRCQENKTLLLMGSATPSLESWHGKQSKTIHFLRLPKRISALGFPHIRKVSLLQEGAAISRELAQAMEETLAKKKQIVLFVNKRGFSRAFLCEHCGNRFGCPNCSVSLVSHRAGSSFRAGSRAGARAGSSAGAGVLRCHHCGYMQKEPDVCSACGYTALSLLGWGTQRVEAEIRKLFPQEAVVRFDSDNTKKKGAMLEMLSDFYKQKYSILIGTQMIAKGINIPNLRLVGILFGDLLLSIPDFRASEKAYSLLEQVAGRASRFSEKGLVIIQSFAKESTVIEHFIRREQEDFYTEELERRKLYNLSPYCRMLRLVLRGKDDAKVKDVAQLCFQKLSMDSQDILGPAPCAMHKLSQNYRWHIILRSGSQMRLLDACRRLLSKELLARAKQSKVYIEIDPDPQQTM